jgi:hypothetical protein
MEIVWPSAQRALELLRGSRVNNAQDVDVTPPTATGGRIKRPAEHTLNDIGDRNVYGVSSIPLTKSHQDFRPPSYDSHLSAQENYAVNSNSGMRPDVTASSTNVSYIPPQQPFDRWAPDGGDQLSYINSLSTSVLPQLYSTGLDDRASASHLSLSTLVSIIRVKHGTLSTGMTFLPSPSLVRHTGATQTRPM